ncbi:hypothetical protein J6590_034699 [Homalodisca vitripennis]|nr:hypothetical protein J6590_094183 [Homalodisca vitripennis]KAG8302386.1 hypothetical protein J6590_034699 [Homalodisca vitripennis]
MVRHKGLCVHRKRGLSGRGLTHCYIRLLICCWLCERLYLIPLPHSSIKSPGIPERLIVSTRVWEIYIIGTTGEYLGERNKLMGERVGSRRNVRRQAGKEEVKELKETSCNDDPVKNSIR